MKDKFKHFYLDIAKRTAELSYARRLKVGSIIVKNNQIISLGYNGTPSGWDNNCEKEKTYFDDRGPTLETKKEVIHSEMNSILKVAKSTESCSGATMFSTHSPCIECSKAIYMAGITDFYYGEEYHSNNGLDFLKKCDVNVEKIG